ncbi:abscisic acid-responsive protein bHLH2 [Tripterygium wilfordii]|uniref:Abscisic acid-responsive protein bHLH2 n=1 Tax=Tripterygium wilfordii TaxID=458696 RepID=A0A7J7BVV3_TRIWF|nr:transcription factor bHLH53-like [Tripterygium wilfordii]KAF5725757.1 abscisic acid-responsive protein bHLH2 [Tripterygium wilfordii]
MGSNVFVQLLVSMAMSFCSNWDSSQLAPTELTEDTFGFGFDIDEFSVSDCLVDPISQSDELFYSNSYTNILPCFGTEYCHLPCFETEHCHYPKRQKSYINQFDSNFTPNLYPNPVPDFILPEIQAPVTFNCEKKANGGSLSVQSMAARERRRKITEKTQELGKLIPGGSKMNIAEMFQAAFNYVKFLRAQVSILELIGSCQEMESMDTKELEILVTSPTMQERLCLEEKCLVPIQFVRSLVDDHDHELELQPLIQQNNG